ncbi:MAG: 6-carboxytetrahydropterin synthase QueD [bacterium]
MYELTVTAHFSAAHRLDGYPGECARLHGHNWKVEVEVQAEELNSLGMAIDFRQLKEALGQVLTQLDHRYLNEIPSLANRNPTSEILAAYIYHELEKSLEGVKLSRIRVWESETTSAAYQRKDRGQKSE